LIYTQINKMKASGASSAEIDEKIKEMADMKEMIKNPVLRFGMALMELFPFGIIVTLISAVVLRKKEILPAYDDTKLEGAKHGTRQFFN